MAEELARTALSGDQAYYNEHHRDDHAYPDDYHDAVDNAYNETVVEVSHHQHQPCSILKSFLHLLSCILGNIHYLIKSVKDYLESICGGTCKRIVKLLKCVFHLILKAICELLQFLLYLVLLPFRIFIAIGIALTNEICCIVGNASKVFEIMLQIIREISPNKLQCGLGWDIPSICRPPDKKPCNCEDEQETTTTTMMSAASNNKSCKCQYNHFQWHEKNQNTNIQRATNDKKNEPPSAIPILIPHRNDVEEDDHVADDRTQSSSRRSSSPLTIPRPRTSHASRTRSTQAVVSPRPGLL